jgi:hypothetical protein
MTLTQFLIIVAVALFVVAFIAVVGPSQPASIPALGWTDAGLVSFALANIVR